MQLCKNYANLKHCIGQKFNAKVIKATHRRSNFSETFASQEIFVSIGLRKKSALKFPKFCVWKMLQVFLSQILSMLVRSWRLSYNTLI